MTGQLGDLSGIVGIGEAAGAGAITGVDHDSEVEIWVFGDAMGLSASFTDSSQLSRQKGIK